MNYYGIPDLEHLEEWTAMGVPFEYNDFMLPGILEQKEETDRRIREYLQVKRDRSQDTIHGPFLDITVHSADPLIKRASDYRIRQVCEIALRLQAKAVIVHTNLIPNFYVPSYRQGWIDANEKYFSGLLQDYPELSIYMENMFDEEPDCLAALASRMKGQRFFVCLDIAHANISKTDISVWQQVCKPYTAHYHINDNHGILDEHLPLGEGGIKWKGIMPDLRKNASVLLEVNSLEHYQRSLDYLNNLHLT